MNNKLIGFRHGHGSCCVVRPFDRPANNVILTKSSGSRDMFRLNRRQLSFQASHVKNVPTNDKTDRGAVGDGDVAHSTPRLGFSASSRHAKLWLAAPEMFLFALTSGIKKAVTPPAVSFQQPPVQIN